MPDSPTPWAAALAALGTPPSGPLRIGGVPALELAERFGTPLYAHGAEALRARIGDVRTAFDGRVDVLLALKANPLLALAETAVGVGAGLEVASAGEVLVAAAAAAAGREAGFAGIQFAGPGKSDEDLAAALAHGARINLESVAEYDRLRTLPGFGPDVRLGIRVNPGLAQSGAKMRMADRSTRFGVDRSALLDLARRLADDGHLDGLHVYAGSQSFDADAWVATASELLGLAGEVADATGAPAVPTLNFGGGFGWPTYEGDPVFDLAAAGAGLLRLLDAAGQARPGRCYVELGRYLVAGGGVFLTRVVDRKESGGRTWLVLDGGMHHFGAAAGLGAVMRRRYAMCDPRDVDAPCTHKFSLGGPLCTPADRFGVDVPLPDLRTGDVLAILNAGAYGLTFSPTRFLGHAQPAEVVVDGGTAHLARARGTPEDALADQRGLTGPRADR